MRLRTRTLVFAAAALLLAAAAKHRHSIVLPSALHSLIRQPTPRNIDRESFPALARDGHRIGPPDAAATIVVFGTYACGYCAELDATLDSLVKRYPAQLAVIHRAFVPNAPSAVLRAHLAVECAASQGMFPAYHSAVFANRNRLTSRTAWLEIATQVGVPDTAAFRRCLADKAYRARLVRDTDVGRQLGVEGTPTSFINGRRIVGAWPVTDIERVLAEESSILPSSHMR